ncbi:hypothetical protein JAO78_015470 [Alishewanella sp. 16-MA]|uniref:BZIP domain-containing protein n=1 Tax=Alishewanella maricola TaxID=2795740 RepID=A0ABS8C795_9ALTE|nr:hypothetical protein [Alishewanella maricola]MCB5228209.1 hypothetical protein [Alishewanella maricola]MDP5036412.1 hypothetical protein [Alishewanella sp.]MDP5187215.1 hypothetical protein [Alishewanella sp.]
MSKRTSPRDAKHVITADDVDDIVSDKRSNWRASAAKARRRQRRYKRMLTQELLLDAQADLSKT